MCDCIKRVNAKLAENGYNAAIEFNMLANPPRALISLYRPRKVRGHRGPILEASFCPFCGKKYRGRRKEMAKAA